MCKANVQVADFLSKARAHPAETGRCANASHWHPAL